MTRCFPLFLAVFRCFSWNLLCSRTSKTKAAENSAFQRKTAEENSMKDIATLALPATTLCRLLQYVEASPGEASAGELAALAIEEWLTRGELGNGPAIRHRGYHRMLSSAAAKAFRAVPGQKWHCYSLTKTTGSAPMPIAANWKGCPSCEPSLRQRQHRRNPRRHRLDFRPCCRQPLR